MSLQGIKQGTTFPITTFSDQEQNLNQKSEKVLGFETRQNLMDFDSNFQGWMQFEQGAHDFTWITHQLMKRIWNFNFGEFF